MQRTFKSRKIRIWDLIFKMVGSCEWILKSRNSQLQHFRGGKVIDNAWGTHTLGQEELDQTNKLNCFLLLHDVLVSRHDVVKIEHFNVKREPSCKPWTLINNNLQTLVHHYNKCATGMQDVNNRGNYGRKERRRSRNMNFLLNFYINLKLLLKTNFKGRLGGSVG